MVDDQKCSPYGDLLVPYLHNLETKAMFGFHENLKENARERKYKGKVEGKKK